MSRTQAEYYAYTPRTQFNSKEVREQIAPIFIFTDTEQQYIWKYRYKDIDTSEIWNWRLIAIPNDNEQINFMNL